MTVSTFRFAVIADTHIIDRYYTGPESTPLDSESIFLTHARLQATRDTINNLIPAVERLFLVGDYIHDYPSSDWSFYFNHKTRLDHAKALTDGFAMPVHIGFGNHDYAVPVQGRTFTHDLFRAKFALEPYYAVTYCGVRFVHLNSFLGDSWDPCSERYDKDVGSLGETQLAWLIGELEQDLPTFVFVHYPLPVMCRDERPGLDLATVLQRFKHIVCHVFAGHWHRWVDLTKHVEIPHLVVAGTRYDPHAYVIVDINPSTRQYRFVNEPCWGWLTHYSRPYTGRNRF